MPQAGCQHCHAQLGSPAAKFCWQCGLALSRVPDRDCAACGYPLSASHSFCPQCGTSAKTSKPEDTHRRSRRWVTILFADIVGFTALSESHEPDEIGSLLDKILEPLTSTIVSEGGVIDKYIGDAIMALFGAHTSSPNDVGNAISAALQMQDQVTQLSHEFERDYGVNIRLRVGINTGKVLAGYIGAPQYRQFTVIGDAVNLASRLEAACEPGRVLVGANTQRFAHHQFEMESGGLISIKGKAAKVAAYYPLYPKPRTAVDIAEHFNGIPIPFMGRKSEVGITIEEHNRLVARNQSSLIYVVGPDSIGKSRFISKVIEQLYAGTTEVLYLEAGQGNFQFLNAIVVPIRNIIARQYNDLHTFTKLLHRSLVSNSDEAAIVSLELLVRFINGHPLTSTTSEEKKNEQQQLLSSLLLALNFLHAQKQLALWVRLDNRIDHDLSKFLEHVGKTNALDSNIPIFVEDTRAPGETSKNPHHESSSCNILIQLEPLSDRVMSGLTHSLLQTAGGAPDWLEAWITEASSGRPGFAIEFLEHLVGLEIIKIDSSLGHWELPAERPADANLPDSVNVVLQAEIDRLPNHEQDLLCRASILDKPFSLQELCSIFNAPESDIQRALDNFVKRKLLRVSADALTDAHYYFRNSSLRSVARDTLTLKDRKKSHYQFAQFLERNDADPAKIAMHYIEAQEWTEALRWTLEAIHIATSSYSLRRSHQYLEEAQSLYNKSKNDLSEHEEILAKLQLRLVESEIAFYEGDTEKAQANLNKVMKGCNFSVLSPENSPAQFKHSLIRLRALATRLSGNLAVRLAKLGLAIQHYEQALQDLATLNRPPSELCSIEASITWALMRDGKTQEAKLRSERALESMQNHKNPTPMMRNAWARHYDTLGQIAMGRNELDDAHALFLAAQALRRVNGSISLLAHSTGNIAGVLALKGEWRNSAEAFEQVADQWASLGNLEMECIGRLNLIECLLELNATEEVSERLRLEHLLLNTKELVERLQSPQLSGIFEGHRERALNAFASSPSANQSC